MRQETLKTYQDKTPERKPGKSQGLRCSGFLTDNGEYETALYGYGRFSYMPSRITKGRFIDVKLGADWLSVSTFKNSKLGRTEENISHTLCCFLDLDGPYTSEVNGEKITLQLTDDIIRQRCNLLGLPMPWIIESSPGRFHVKFYFKSPVPISKRGYIKAVQRALHQAFKDMGADPVVTEDMTRFLRNENQTNSVNKKYPNKPPVVIREEGRLTSLSELYHALKKHGFTRIQGQGSTNPRRARQIPFHVSQHSLITFLIAHNGITTTYRELFTACNVSESTGYVLISGLKKAGKISVENIRACKTWRTKFTFKKVDTLRKESLSPGGSSYLLKKRFLDVVRRVSLVGLPATFRNKGSFMLSLGLKVSGYGEPDALSMLRPGFSLSRYAGKHRFTEREFVKTVNSPFKRDYRYCVGLQTEKWFSFLRAITNLECETLRNLGKESGPALGMVGGETWQSQRMQH